MCETKNFLLWLLQFVALLGLLAFILWLTLRPKDPSYTIVDFSVPVPDNGSGQDNQNGSLSYTLEIVNPNRDSDINYNDIFLLFYYNQDTIGEKTITHFHQGKDKTTQIMDHVNANARVWKALVNAISNKTGDLKVGLMTKIRYRTWGIKSKHHGMNLQGRVPIGSDGKISGKKKKIKLRNASKKWRVRLT
ncbi:unnamed protein product [Ilex paraguariensis]|uniref:Late embryogenesis abundant protein LEA-2 subgroup domain-containing protein n=1 Tax=Ilex paraguariensis TaxID=185542 RepID=A0ABC8U050_9AQUA